MKKLFTILLVCVVCAVVQADLVSQPYIAGDFNGWDPGALPMTSLGGGLWEYTITGLAAGQYQQFKITPGNWDVTAPASNSWYSADASGEVTITFNTNVVSDGWLPAQFRVGVSTEPGSWSLVGDYNGWNNADPTQAMTDLGGGIYMITQTFAAGSYNLKPTQTGTWDAIGTDGRSIDAWNYNLVLSETSDVTVYVDALNGLLGIGDVYFDPANPDPKNGAVDVAVDALTLSWDIARDPADPNAADPDLISHELYMSEANDPNLYYIDDVIGWDSNLRASYTLSSSLEMDSQYLWRVREIRTSGDVDKLAWRFNTQRSIPIITVQPGYQVVAATGTANFTITVSSVSEESYKWYKYVDGVSDTELTNGGDISGATTNSLSIANAELGDEGAYYCVVNNESGIPSTSDNALLGIKRELAKWSFESGSYQSGISGSPGTRVYGDPSFVTGQVGSGMSFDGNDMLYIDPNFASYFDICNYSMTIECWVKDSFAEQWNPMVSRYGDSGEGWQFRHNGSTLDSISFTTRGTGIATEDGTGTSKTVFDGDWHYAVATYDGTEKKVYVDGVLNVTDAASDLINSTTAPVALAGRVHDNAGSWIFEGFMSCVLDDVSIYNYARGANIIAQTYADITQTNVCPENPTYDLNGNCKVDLPDLALLAQNWLTDNTVYPN